MGRCLMVAVAVAVGASACGTRVSEEDARRYRQGLVNSTSGGAQAPGPDDGAAPAAGSSTAPPASSGTAAASPSGAASPGPGSVPAGSAGAAGPGRAPTAVGPAALVGSKPPPGGGSAPVAGTTTPTAPSPVEPKDPILIGAVGVLSGPIGTNMKPISDGVRIWVRSINDRGGINGHPVSLVQGDSGADPARHRALVQEFVEQKRVVAFVGQPGDVFSGASSVDYLTKAGVPVIGSEGGANWYYESSVYFPQMAHGRVLVQSLAVGTALEMGSRRQTKLALWTCIEAQTCTDIDQLFPKVVPRHGVNVVHRSKISIGQPDFTAECLNARNAGAQAVVLAADGATILRAAASCARQGYDITFAIFGAEILAKQHAEDPNLDGAIVLDTTAPWFLVNAAPRREFVDAAARFAPTLPPGSPMANGWVAAKVFEYAAGKAAEPLGKATILQALGAIRGDVLPDLTGPLLFSPGRPATPSSCYYAVTLDKGRWASPDGGQRHCFDYDPSI